MRRLSWVVAMVGIALGVGVLAVYGDPGWWWFSGGVRTTGLEIGPNPGEGEGEGEVEDDVLAFDSDYSKVRFYGGQSEIDFQGNNSKLSFDGSDSAIEFVGDSSTLTFGGNGAQFFIHSGVLGFVGVPPETGGAFLAGGPCAQKLEHIPEGYVGVLASTDLIVLQGLTGTVGIGHCVIVPGEGEGEGEGETELRGVRLIGMNEYDSGTPRSLVLADPKGGLDEDQDPAAGPSAEMSVLDADQVPTARVTLKGNATEGEVEIANNASASIKISAAGDVVVTLGSSPQNNQMAPNGDGLMMNQGSAANAAIQAQGADGSQGPRPGVPRPVIPERLLSITTPSAN